MATLRRITIEGESYLTLTGIAECFSCEVSWIEEVYSLGLLGVGRNADGEFVVLSSLLDRVAEIRRINVHYGVHLTAVSILLERKSG